MLLSWHSHIGLYFMAYKTMYVLISISYIHTYVYHNPTESLDRSREQKNCHSLIMTWQGEKERTCRIYMYNLFMLISFVFFSSFYNVIIYSKNVFQCWYFLLLLAFIFVAVALRWYHRVHHTEMIVFSAAMCFLFNLLWLI